MPIRLLGRSQDPSNGGEFLLEVDYSEPQGGNPRAIDYYNQAIVTNTTTRGGAVRVVRRDDGSEVAVFPVPAGTPRTVHDLTGYGPPAQRRRYDLQPQWPSD